MNLLKDKSKKDDLKAMNPKMKKTSLKPNEMNKLPRALRCLVDYNYTGKDKGKAIESAVATNSMICYAPPVRKAAIKKMPVQFEFKTTSASKK